MMRVTITCETCGWSSMTDTQARAQYALRRHSCVDAQPVREHLAALALAGVGLKRVAVLSGVSHGSLSKLVHGTRLTDRRRRRRPSSRVRAATAAAIFALDPADPALPAPGAVVDATQARRRLEVMVANGWSVALLADRLQLDRQILDGVLTWKRTRIRAGMQRAVVEGYQSLRGLHPPEATWHQRVSVAQARNRGAREGWPLSLSDLVTGPHTLIDCDVDDDLEARVDWVRRRGILVPIKLAEASA